MFDLNDVEPIQSGELIPHGTFAKVTMTLRPGGIDGFTEIDRGLLKPSNSPGSDVLLLDCEFTVVEGPFTKRKFWQTFTVTGGKVDDKGAPIGWNISKRIFRAMIDSALGLDSEDMSEAAKAKRQLRGLADLNGCRQGCGRAQQGSALPRPQPARSPRATEREGMAGGDERRDRPAAAIEAPRSERRRERSGAGVGRRATEARGGTADDRRTTMATSGRNVRTGSAANHAARRTAGEAGGPCLAERL